MQQELFDNFTRSLSIATSRRDVFRLFTGLVFAGAASYLSWSFPKIAFAQISRNCSATVNTQGECPPGQEKTRNPNYFNDPNGCGSQFGTEFPNSFILADFTACCDNHDSCYANCNIGRGFCDTELFSCLVNSCELAFPFGGLLQSVCTAVAYTYYVGVNSVIGEGVWQDAQRVACLCCEECSASGVPCGVQCCAPCDQCISGTCQSTGTDFCNGQCTDLSSDQSNCGSCGIACGDCFICKQGSCVPKECGPCEFCLNDECIFKCSGCSICDTGTCVYVCGEGQACCNNKDCYDITEQHCCLSTDGSHAVCQSEGQHCCATPAATCCNANESCCVIGSGIRACVPFGDDNCGFCNPCPPGSHCCLTADGTGTYGCCSSEEQCNPPIGCV